LQVGRGGILSQFLTVVATIGGAIGVGVVNMCRLNSGSDPALSAARLDPINAFKKLASIDKIYELTVAFKNISN
jgi:type III secretory pathway component EscU